MRSFVSILVALVVALSAAPGAFAADKPVASEPRPHQVLSAPPGWVTLAFSTQLDESQAKLLVMNSKGESVTVNSIIVEGTNMTMQLKDGLPEDTYTVHYRLNGNDGDVQGGAFQFAYGSADWTSLKDASWSGSDNEPALFKDTDPQGNPIATSSPSKVPDVVVVPSEGPTISINASPIAGSASPSAAGETTATPGAASPALWIGVALAAALAVGAAAFVMVRRRKG